MMISTYSAFQATNAVDMVMYLYSGTVPEQADVYYDREAIATKAVAAVKMKMTVLGKLIQSGNYSDIKIGAGGLKWVADNTSDIVIPTSVKFPRTGSVSSAEAAHQSNLCLIPPRSITYTDKNTMVCGGAIKDEYVVFEFRADTTLTKMSAIMTSVPNLSIDVSVNGTDWTAAGTIAQGTGAREGVLTGASGIRFVRIKLTDSAYASNALDFTGNFMFFGTEVATVSQPITHAFVAPFDNLTSMQTPLMLSAHDDKTSTVGFLLTAGGPLSTGKEVYMSADKAAPGASITPVTFTLSGNILVSA